MLFLTQNWQKFHANFLQIVFLAKLVFNFHSGISINTTLCLWIWLHLMENIKKTTEIPVFLCFLTTLYQIWPKFGPADHTHFTFFGWFPMKYVWGFNNLCYNPVKLVKPLRNCFLSPICTKMGHYGPHPKWETIFFGRNN